MDTNPSHEGEAEMPSEQETMSSDRTSPQNDSEGAFWVPSDLDSDEAEQMNKEESGSQVDQRSDHDVVEEKSQSSLLSSKKGRKRKRLAQAVAAVKKQKLVIIQ